MANPIQPAPLPISILRRRDVEVRTGLSRSTIYLRLSEGRFPAPVKLGGRAVGWVESEIQAWLTEQVSNRSGTRASVGGA